MAGVFLSYDRDDTDRARHFAHALETAGHAVWWDLHVRGGAQFSKVIEEALKAADAVVVLWSRNSIESPWVRDEAAAGRDSGRLIPVTIDGTEPPLGFRQFQTIDLRQWKGRGRPMPLKILLSDVAAMAASTEKQDGDRNLSRPMPAERAAGLGPIADKRLIFLSLALALLLSLGGIAYWLWSKQASGSTDVAVIAGGEETLSQQMARDLLVKLSVLQGSAAMNINLIADPAAARRTDLRLAISGSQRGVPIDGSVALIGGKAKTLLWSKEITQSNGARDELEEALAFAAARVLSCATEEASGRYGRLSEDLRRLYLNACTALGEVGWDNRVLLPQLKHITEQAPRFRPAWAKLITAQSDYASSLDVDLGSEASKAARAELQRLINEGRKVDPNMAEATLAELVVDPNMPIEKAIALVEQAKQADPRNPLVLRAHGGVMQSVGRMGAAVDDLQAAAELDPLSPFTRADLIGTLLYAGAIDQARAQLAEASRLWPGVPAINQAKYTFELHEDDPAAALKGLSMEGPGATLYVTAVKDPSEQNVNAILSYLRTDLAGPGLGRLGFVLQLLGQIDKPAEAYALIDKFGPSQINDLKRNSYILFRPWMASLRRDPRFMQLSRRLGLTAYWRSSGNWPDFCRQGILYDCKSEAAKSD